MRTRDLPVEHELTPFASGFPPGKRWLFLSPHPDDEVLGPAGTLVRAHREGVEIALVIVTDGGAQGSAVEREAEARAASATLGLAEPLFLRFADRSLRSPDPKLHRAIVDLLRRFAPDTLFVTSPVELHPDHRALAVTAHRALRSWSLWGTRRRPPVWVAAYEVATPLLPNLLVAVDETWEVKRQAAACYASQLAYRRYDLVMEALATQRTLTLEGVRRAEALHVLPVRQVVRQGAGAWASQMGSPVGLRRQR